MDDAFTYTCKAFELAEGGTTVFEVEEYLLLDGFVKLLEGATVGGACFCFYHQHDLVVIVAMAHAVEGGDELIIVLSTLEDVLVVDAAHHDVVDAGARGFAGLSGHRDV